MPFLAMVADRSSSSIPKVVIASAPHTSYSIPLPSHRFRCLPAGRSSHASGFPRLRTCIHRLFRHAFSGTCNKDFPRLWTQLAGRPRNRYSAGIRSFRSTSPPFFNRRSAPPIICDAPCTIERARRREHERIARANGCGRVLRHQGFGAVIN